MISYSNFKIIPDKKLIIEYFSGKIELKDILELKRRESIEKEYNSNFNIIDDSRDAEFLLNQNEISTYVNHIINNKLINGKRNAAYLTKTPNQVVIATLFDMLKKELPINVKIFSTVEVAMNWLELSEEDKKLVEFYLEELRKHN
ncbi:MAG: hypothetical protein GQ564_23510 [Bacteroidales bacterium]|nr:hypothetical protein [Bacteroidales bacterium]